MRVAILTVSSSGATGQRKDTSGAAIAAWAGERGHSVASRALVSDDVVAIARCLLEWCDADVADLVLTTGGTGLSPTDVTPCATAVVIERDAPGISELLRARGTRDFPRAALAQGRAGIRNRSLVVNLPGSAGGVRDGLAALDPVIEHAIAVLRGEVRDHDAK